MGLVYDIVLTDKWGVSLMTSKSNDKKDDDTVSKLNKKKQRPPFTPLTGNPENGDYLDFYNSLREGEVVLFKKRE